jgi:hypothetical protein
MADNKSPIQAYLENRHDESIGGFTVPLPITKDKLWPWLEAIEAISKDDVVLRSASVNDINLIGMFDNIAVSDMSFDELNYLAVKIQGMDDSHRDVFSAVVCSGRDIASLADLINITENLQHFDLQPAYDAKQYGDFQVEYAMGENAKGFEKLRASDDPDLLALADYIEFLETHVDRERYGKDIAENEGGAFTPVGYIQGGENIPEVYHDLHDIPLEYRIFTAPEPLPMVEGASVPEFLTMLHNLVGDYEREAHLSIDTLLALRSSEYLLLLDGSSAYLTAAAHAYRQGSDEHKMWVRADGENATAFAIHLTEVHGEITGDIALIDVKARQDDIAIHHISPVKIEVTLQRGDVLTPTPQEFNVLSLLEKDSIQSCRREFADRDFAKLFRHLDYLTEKDAQTHKVVTTDVFLSEINVNYMAKSEFPQEDMLRIPQQTAKEMLARGDAEVYRLLPSGPEKLSPMDAVKSGLWFSESREYAIKREDMPGLSNWAERKTVEIINHPNQRDKPGKNHSQEI